MEENINDEVIEQSSEVIEQSSESSEQSVEISDVQEVIEENSDLNPTTEDSDRNLTEMIQTVIPGTEEQTEDEEKELKEDSVEQVEETEEQTEDEVMEEEKQISTVVQVIENPDSETGFDVTELDVESLNMMSESYVDTMLAVTPTSNDYYTFIDTPISTYFSGVMANYPLNEYRAYHLRHWVYNSSYSSYYDDYYYLFYDYPSNNCIEIVKYHDSSQYQITDGTAEILASSITYGSQKGVSDLREGVNYVSWLSALCVLGSVLVLYIVNAIFKHLRS